GIATAVIIAHGTNIPAGIFITGKSSFIHFNRFIVAIGRNALYVANVDSKAQPVAIGAERRYGIQSVIQHE
ncbi:hypothetical protein, partial [Spirosoma sp. 48-14]|uniref:hypothetical protein n=1 Tax=Spirosoma sp. 48-14 TaxID=1895854 RepID=UPI0025E1A231